MIRLATADESERITELIAGAFLSLDVTAWLVSDPHERARVLPANFRIFVDHAFVHGEVHVIEDERGFAAAAVWLPQISGPTPQPPDYDTRVAAACGAATPRFRVLDQLFDDYHAHIYPHHHLAYLATRPDRQRRGLGSTLLRYHHAYLDENDLPAYLDASSPPARALYERHGYECLDGPFHLPDGPPLWPMWRARTGERR